MAGLPRRAEKAKATEANPLPLFRCKLDAVKPRLCVGLLTAIAAIGAEPAVQWSGTDGGFQLGIAGTKASTGTPAQLQFTIRNLASEWRSVHFGADISAGAVSDIVLTAHCGGEQAGDVHIVDLNTRKWTGEGYISEFYVAIQAGKAHVLTLPISRFVGVLNGQDIPLESLLQRGCSIRASFQPVGHVLIFGHTLVTPALSWSQFQ